MNEFQEKLYCDKKTIDILNIGMQNFKKIVCMCLHQSINRVYFQTKFERNKQSNFMHWWSRYVNLLFVISHSSIPAYLVISVWKLT